MTAIIMDYTSSRTGTEIARVEMEDDRAVIKAGSPGIRADILRGTYIGGKRLNLADGEEFIKSLPAKYSGSATRATLI